MATKALALLTVLVVTISAEDCHEAYVYPSEYQWIGPTKECALINSVGEVELACVLPSGRITVKVGIADRGVTIECEDRKYSCEELRTVTRHLENMTSEGTIPILSIKDCALPAEPFKCILSLVNATDVERIFVERPSGNLEPIHVEGLTKVTWLKIRNTCPAVTKFPYDALQKLPLLGKFVMSGGTLNLSVIEDVGEMPNLKSLELSSGYMTELPANAFRQMPHLTFLSLYHNKIQTVDENAFLGLSSLVNLSLNSNQLTELPDRVFRPTPALERIDLYENQIEKLSSMLLPGLNKLKMVFIFNNKVPLTLDPGAFSQLPSLSTLKMNNCNLQALPENLFFNSTQLQYLIFSYNKLNEVPENLLQGLLALEELHLNNNILKTIPPKLFVGYRPKMNALYLQNNQLNYINENALSGLPALRKLKMDFNHLRELSPAVLGALTGLEFVSLAYNELTLTDSEFVSYDADGRKLRGQVMLPSPFAWLTSLKVIDLAHNRIAAVPDDLRLKTQLETLNLSHNHIAALTFIDLAFVSETSVDLTNNNITEIRPVSNFDLETSASFRLGFNPLACDCNLYSFIEESRKGVFSNKIDFENARCANPTNLKGQFIADLNTNLLTCKADCPENCSCEYHPAKSKIELTCMNYPRVLPKTSALYNSIDLTLKSTDNLNSTLPSSIGLLNLSSLQLTRPPTINSSVEIDLTNNMLEHPPVQLFKANVTLRLSRNKFQCQCSSLDEIYHFEKYQSLIRDYANVTCEYGRETLLVSNFTSQIGRLCPNRVGIVIGGILVIVVVIAVAMMVAWSCYRVEIRILLKRFGCYDILFKGNATYKKFDAFVSFAHPDEQYVVNKLIPNLEGGRRPIRLCVHSRDWIIGDFIPDQITRSVEDSSVTIIVLSKHFLTSMWADIEFKAAFSKDRVVILLLEDIPEELLDKELKACIKLKTYVRADDSMVYERLKEAVEAKQRKDKKAKRVPAVGLDVESLGGILVNKGLAMPPKLGSDKIEDIRHQIVST